MGFVPVKNDAGNVLPWEYLPAVAGTYKAGQLLKVDGGKLTALGAATATTPPYLCMGEKTIADGELLPVTRVSEHCIYETTLAAAAAGADTGTKLQVAADGLTASGAAAGTFEVVTIESTEAGGVVRGRWV